MSEKTPKPRKMGSASKAKTKAPDLLNQYRGEAPPPVADLTPDELMQGKKTPTRAQLTNKWFEDVKAKTSPDGNYLGVETKILDPKDYADGVFKGRK